jgi:hypothetical protein
MFFAAMKILILSNNCFSLRASLHPIEQLPRTVPRHSGLAIEPQHLAKEVPFSTPLSEVTTSITGTVPKRGAKTARLHALPREMTPLNVGAIQFYSDII